MRILLVNYHYFLGGGPDSYFFAVKEALEGKGVRVRPFAFKYDENIPSEFADSFPEPIVGSGPALLAQHRLTPLQVAKGAMRMFYNSEAAARFRKVLTDFRPDLIYSIYLSSSFLPQLLSIAKQEFNIPVLYRLSDFHMHCGNYHCFRDQRPCQDCDSHLWNIVRHRCMKGSYIASALRAAQMQYVRSRGWYDAVDRFICPSQYMADFLVSHGIDRNRIAHVPTFCRDLSSPGTCLPLPVKPYALFLGKVNQEKGAEFLLRAFNLLPFPLIRIIMVGPVNDEYRKHLLSLVDDMHRSMLEIVGPLPANQVDDIVKGAEFLVHPALWYENQPNAVLEGLSAGKPVIACNIGSMPELVENNVNGVLVPPGDVRGLVIALKRMSTLPEQRELMGYASRTRYLLNHSMSVHLQTLTSIVETLTVPLALELD